MLDRIARRTTEYLEMKTERDHGWNRTKHAVRPAGSFAQLMLRPSLSRTLYKVVKDGLAEI